MLTEVGFANIEELIAKTIPQSIRQQEDLSLPNALDEKNYCKTFWK